MVALSFVSALVFGVAAVSAIPTPNKGLKCSLQNAKMSLPAGQTALAQQTVAPAFIGIGVGVQNYTCNATSGTYVSAGAVAELFDISCFYNTPLFDMISDMSFKAWSKAPAGVTTQDVISKFSNLNLPLPGAVLGEHYFIKANATAPLQPKWDFTSHGKYKGNSNAFVVGAKVNQLAAPTGAQDVPLLELKGVSGKLATNIYRLATRGGQPPASCKAGETASVKYTSQYWLFGNTA